MANEQALYPRGRVAFGVGDLVDVTNIKIDTTNNAKQVHTIRRRGAGFTLGTEETTVTFDLVVSEHGEERDWIDAMKRGLVKQIRLKLPGRTMTINGAVKSVSTEMPLDDAIKQNVTFIGHLED